MKDKNREKEFNKELQDRNVSRFGSTFALRGTLKAEENLIIDGRFQGKIDLGKHNLIVGRGARIRADIHAKNVTILGNLKGNIFAIGKVYISENGQVEGDISAFRISIMDGAQFKGSIKMIPPYQQQEIFEKPSS